MLACVYNCLHVYTHVYVYVRMWKCVYYACECVFITHVYTCAHVYVCLRTYTCTFSCLGMSTCVRMSTNEYVYVRILRGCFDSLVGV